MLIDVIVIVVLPTKCLAVINPSLVTSATKGLLDVYLTFKYVSDGIGLTSNWNVCSNVNSTFCLFTLIPSSSFKED